MNNDDASSFLNNVCLWEMLLSLSLANPPLVVSSNSLKSNIKRATFSNEHCNRIKIPNQCIYLTHETNGRKIEPKRKERAKRQWYRMSDKSLLQCAHFTENACTLNEQNKYISRNWNSCHNVSATRKKESSLKTWLNSYSDLFSSRKG